MKQPIRFFSIGLLTSALIMLGFYFFGNSDEESIDNLSTDDLIAKVEEDGYRVITEDEFISFSVYAEKEKENGAETPSEDQAPAENDDTEKENPDENQEDAAEVKKVKFTIKEGDFTPDIADILLENKIIDDKDEFIKFVEENDYSPYIQLGKFEVTSEMSLKELAETITTYPGD